MPTPIEAYRQGYEKGRSDSAGGRLAEMTMGMLRDDPGGHFQSGYGDGAAGKPFSPPSMPQKSLTKGLIPKFSENPIGWLLGVLIVIELWALWQLVKAPFELIAPLTRGDRPSPWVIAKSVIVAGLIIAMVWWVPRMNDATGAQAAPSTPPSIYSVSVTDYGNGTHTNTLIIGSRKTVLSDQELSPFALIAYNNPHDLMRVLCPTGFRVGGTNSPTGNRAFQDTDNMAGIEVFSGKPNTLLVTCQR